MSGINMLLPIVQTKKIHISSINRKIDVDVAMSLTNRDQFASTLRELGMEDKLFLYFVLLNDSSAGLLPGIFNFETRSRALQHGVSTGLLEDSLFRFNMSTVLENEEDLFSVSDYTNPDYGEYRSSFSLSYGPREGSPVTIVIDPLTYEAPESSEFSETYIDFPWRGRGFAQAVGQVQDAGTIPGQSRSGPRRPRSLRKMIKAEKSKPIELTLRTSPPPYEEMSTDNLHLLTFIHADYNEEFANRIGSFGGEMVYDLLLNRLSEGGPLIVPPTRKVFYIDDPAYISQTGDLSRQTIVTQTGEEISALGEESRQPRDSVIPYSGPYHYHSEEDAHPDGYVGYMAGPAGGPMGPRLSVRTVQNYKITSDFELPLNSNDNRLVDEQFLNLGDQGLLANSNLLSEAGHHSVVQDANTMIKDILKHASVSCNTKPNIIDYGAREMSFINLVTAPGAEGASPLEQSHYGCAIGINFLKLVKYKSRLGFLIDFHERNHNLDFVTSALYYSNVLDINIKRRRLTDTPYLTNDQDSFQYGDHDQGIEKDQEIVSSSDRKTNILLMQDDYQTFLRGRLFEKRTFRGHIEEVEILETFIAPDGSIIPQPSKGYNREFIVRDYDLFHNVNYGKYTYIVDIILNDGVHRIVEDMCSYLDTIRSDMEQLLRIAAIPLRLSENGETEGNYDYTIKRFSNSFSSNQENIQIIDRSIQAYDRAHRFLTGKSLHPDTRERLVARMHLSVATIEDVSQFKEGISDLFNSINSILETGIRIYNKDNYTLQDRNVTHASSNFVNTIQVSSRTGVVSNSFSETDIFADYFPDISQQDPPIFIPAPELPRLFREGVTTDFSILPRRFGTVDFASFNPYFNLNITMQGQDDTGNASVPGILPEDYGSESTQQLPPPVAQRGRLSKRSSKSSEITIISNRREYQSLPPIQKQNQDIKIKFLTSDREISRSYLDAPDESIFGAIRSYSGGVTLGLSRSFGSPLRNSFDNYFELLERLSPGLSSETKKVICEAAFKEETATFFLDLIEERVKDAVLSREALGSFYNVLHSRLAIENSFNLGSSASDYTVRFEGRAPSTAPPIPNQDVYEVHKKRLHILNTEGMYTELTSLNVSIEPSRPLGDSPRTVRKLICLKATSNQKTSDAVIVNDTMFVEVKN